MKNLFVVYVHLCMDNRGQEGLHLDAHSRGSMAVGNTLEHRAKDPEAKGSLSGTTVSFYGPAYNAEKADKILSNLQGRDAIEDSEASKKMKLKLENHLADPVGRLIGGNPATGGVIPEEESVFKVIVKALSGAVYTSHNCYGNDIPDQCNKHWKKSDKE